MFPKSRQGAFLAAIAFTFGALVTYTLQQRTTAGPTAAGAAAVFAGVAVPRAAASRFHQVPCPPPRQPAIKPRNLVFAAVGDDWSPAKWSYSDEAGWDLVAVYFGNRSDWSCPQCTLALRMPDSMKWQMVWGLMTEQRKEWRGIWQKFRESYDYVMVADDDLLMDACTIDIFFNTMRQHGLLVAQPSNCRGNDSDNPYWVHWQLPGMELHYVNVIEVTAPALDMRFLNNKIRPLLEITYSGWGLPFCFTAAAGFPRSRLAAIDASCMIHPARAATVEKMSVSARIKSGNIKAGSIYSRFAELTPFESPLEEQRALWQECGFTASAAAAAREAYPPLPIIHGTVLGELQAAVDRGAAAGVASPPARQQLTAAAASMLPPGSQLSTDVLLVSLQLCLAAVAGAAAAYSWGRRSTGGGGGGGGIPFPVSAAGRMGSPARLASPGRLPSPVRRYNSLDPA